MAFKKTGGRASFVQPTGMPDLSGFFDSAKTMQEIGNLSNSIGTDIRKREYNDLIRQAEIDGSTAGAVFKDGKLQPLVNFDYAKATETYSSGDQKNVLDAYRKSAIRTYVSAASNDIDLAAQTALDNNANDPDGVRGSFSGFIEGLEDLDPQIKAALMPKAVKSFGVAENRALAQQQKEAKEDSIYQNGEAFQALSVEKGKLIASFDDDEAGNEAKLARLREIEDEQSQIKDSLTLNEVSAEKISKIEDADRTVVAARVGTNYIKKIYAANGAEAAHNAASDIEEQAKLNPDLDEKVLGEIAHQTVSSLISMDALRDRENTKLQKSIFNDLNYRVKTKGLDINSLLLDPKSDFFKLDGSQRTTLLAVSEQSQQELVNVVNSQNQKILIDQRAIIDNPEIHTIDQVRAAGRTIASMRDNGDITSYKDIVDAKMAYRKAAAYFNTGTRNDIASSVYFELNKDTSSFVETPAYYNSPEFISKLEASGVIGPDSPHYKTRGAYDKAIASYVAAYQDRADNISAANKAERKARNNIPLSADEISKLVEHKGFDKFRTQNESGQDVLVDIDLLSDDPTIVAGSIDAVSNFSVETSGLLHPDAAEIFSRAPYTMQNADLATRIMGQIVSGIRQKTPGTTKATAVSMFLAGNDISEETIGFIRTVDQIGIENAMQSYAADKGVNKNRNVNSYLSNNGLDKDAFFNKTFEEALENEKFLTLIQTTISPEAKQMLNQIASEGGVGNIEGAFIKDPTIKQAVMNIFYDKVSSVSAGTPVTHMQDTIRQLGKRLGVQKNPSTGQLEFVKHPILKLAQSTVPTAAGQPVVSLSYKDIQNDVRDRIVNSFEERFDLLNPPTKSQEYMYQMLRDVGIEKLDGTTMHFQANESFGGEPSYSVYVQDKYGRAHLVSNSYTYDFKDSKAYKETYKEVISELKTDKAKQFWSMYGLMDKGLVQSTFEAMERNRTDSSLDGLVNAWNAFSRVTNPSANPWSASQISQEEKEEFFYIVDRLTTLGWR